MEDISQKSDEEVWESIRHQTLDELAQEIGRMCLYWSELEMEVSMAFDQLLGVSDRVVGNVLIGALDFRSKLQAFLPIAFHKRINDVWYENIETLVNHIDNNLRPERNRIIHDSWIEMPGLDEPHRMRILGKVVKPQSRTRELQLANYRPFTPKDVGLLYVQMIRAKGTLRRQMFEHQANSDRG